MTGKESVSDNHRNIPIFRLPPWSPNNHFQLSLLFPAFLFCILVLMTTQRARLETHQNSTENSSFIKHSAFLWNKACLPIFHQSLHPGPLPCDLEVLPLRGREFPPLDYKQAHVTCFNQWDFNSGEESRNSSVLERLSLLARALSFPRRRTLPWWPPLLQSELPLSRRQ